MVYLLQIFTLEFLYQFLKTLFVRIDADGGEDALDVFGAGGGVAAETQEEVCCEVLHCCRCFIDISISIKLCQFKLFRWEMRTVCLTKFLKGCGDFGFV